ncbi:MAG: glycoside hydrolase family 2 [Bacteroidales bacterium]|nr:glycoside hydrolase family 2 [Bacteroidales bacterium]
MKKILAVAVLLTMVTSCAKVEISTPESLSIAGAWQVSLDSLATFQPIQLPGTTDDAGLGEPNTLQPALQLPQLQSLRRKHSFIGYAFYKRTVDIPESMAGQPLKLKLERVLWQSSVWIDGVQLEGAEESLVSAHRYMVPQGLSAGPHEIVLRIDNRKRYDISRNELAHAYTNDTQIKWNGVLGEMSLTVVRPVEIARVDVYPSVRKRSVEVVTTLVRHGDADKASVTVLTDLGGRSKRQAALAGDTTVVRSVCRLGGRAALWDEFNPDLHRVTVVCGDDSRTVPFGLREITTEGTHIKVNGRTVFMRGTLDCCIFPLTGTPPTDEAGWEKVFTTVKDWGLNHVRFHSWCPPDAAFRVADRMGIYLQPELPIWSSATVYPAVQAFLMAETDRILEDYGNHPSFCMLSGGNELDRGYEYLNEWLRYLKQTDPRHIYTNATYSMGGDHKGSPEPEDQYFIASRSKLGQVRGQDYLNAEVPDFTHDYSRTAIDQGVPMISHEVGQYSVYPDIREIDKYTGVLEPLNFISVRESLREKGYLDKAEDYTMASGRLAAILYKEEIERALKTPGLSGFQLLGLQDFPGQATALVGLVNSFWENKGLVTEAWFRQACAPVTPLVRYRKACWTSDETFTARVEVANYWSDDISGRVKWSLENGGKTIGSGTMSASLPTGCTTALQDSIQVDLSPLSEAAELTLRVSLEGTEWSNSWNVWVYPAAYQPDFGSVVAAKTYDEAVAQLKEGKTVLLSPDPALLAGEQGKFVPVFWSPVFFPGEAGTMGVLCDPSHPALAGFPTEMHSNWQWWTLTKHSRALNLDPLPQVGSIIEAVDNFVRNRRLSYLFEAQCGNGRLVVSAMDLLGEQDAGNPEVKQLLGSVLAYMNSDAFHPAGIIGEADLKSFFRQETPRMFPMFMRNWPVANP